MKKILLMSAVAVALLTSCGKQKAFVADNFAVSPTPLEYMAGEVPATISINVPAKLMNKKAVVTCTPVLKWDGGASVADSYTLQGEKVEANHTIISYKNGGHATMRFSVPFKDGMEKSDLLMQFNATIGKKAVKMPTVKIGYGTQCTAVINHKQEAAVKFLIGQANLRGSELNSKTVQDFIATLKNIKSDEQSLVLNNIEVSAYASPDGAYAINERLAEKRGEVSEGYVNQQLKQNKLSKTGRVSRHSFLHLICRTRSLSCEFFPCIPTPSSANVRFVTWQWSIRNWQMLCCLSCVVPAWLSTMM